jgi:hypothetical protein
MKNFSSIAIEAFKMGAIIGLVQIVLTLLLYIMGIEYMVKWWVSILVIVSIIALLVVYGLKWRKSVGGYATFGEIFQFQFVAFAATMFVSTLFNILLYNVIDGELALNMKEAVVDSTMAMMEGFGIEGEALDAALVEFDDFEDNFSVVGLLMSFIKSLIGGAVLAAILSLFLKKNEEMFPDVEEA